MLAGSANLSSVGAAEVARQLTIVFDGLGRDGVSAVCVGAAGVDSPEQEERLRELVQDQVPGAVVQIVHDTRLILAAAGVEHGIALIAGTGSVAWGRAADGWVARAGGWGYLLGDEGSGYWVGLQAVRHALAQTDRGEPARPAGPATDRRLRTSAARPITRPFLCQSGAAVLGRSFRPGLPAGGGWRCGRRGRSWPTLPRPWSTSRRWWEPHWAMAGPVVLGGGLLIHQPRLQVAVRDGLTAIGLSTSAYWTAIPRTAHWNSLAG